MPSKLAATVGAANGRTVLPVPAFTLGRDPVVGRDGRFAVPVSERGATPGRTGLNRGSWAFTASAKLTTDGLAPPLPEGRTGAADAGIVVPASTEHSNSPAPIRARMGLTGFTVSPNIGRWHGSDAWEPVRTNAHQVTTERLRRD